MTPLVELISEWSAFEEKHPDGTLETFCRCVLEKKRHPIPYPMSQNVAVEQLMQAIERLSDAYTHYQRLAMKEVGLPATDSFFYLQSLNHLGEIQKVVLIRYQYAEPTTGRKAIEKLVKASYVQERPDPDDARATLIKLTENGKRKLHECRILAGKVNKVVFYGLDTGAIEVCKSFLSPLQQKHSRLATRINNLSFGQIYNKLFIGDDLVQSDSLPNAPGRRIL